MKVKKIFSGCLLTLAVVIAIAIALLWAMKSRITSGAMMEEAWSKEDGEEILDLKYGERPRNVYDLYLPNEQSFPRSELKGLMLFVHGGSWLGGDKSHQAYQCKRYVKEGYVTATMNYTLLDSNHPEVNMFTMTDEIDACIHAIIDECTGRGVNLRWMMLSGQSAGGHLAMLYGYKYQSPLPLRFLAIQVGPVNLANLFPNESEEKQDTLRMFSPISYVSAEAPPAILAYGAKDNLINLAHPRELCDKYDSLSIPYEYIEFPHSGHMLNSDEDCAKRYFDCIRKWARKAEKTE